MSDMNKEDKVEDDGLIDWLEGWQTFCKERCDLEQCFGDKEECEQAYQDIKKLLSQPKEQEEPKVRGAKELLNEFVPIIVNACDQFKFNDSDTLLKHRLEAFFVRRGLLSQPKGVSRDDIHNLAVALNFQVTSASDLSEHEGVIEKWLTRRGIEVEG